jgi:hypothetical protein
MTATVIPFPPNQYARPFLRHARTRKVVRRYTKRPDGWRYLPALANAEQLVRLALKRTDVQPISRKIWPAGVVGGGGR